MLRLAYGSLKMNDISDTTLARAGSSRSGATDHWSDFRKLTQRQSTS
jgi:hypothetical protein